MLPLAEMGELRDEQGWPECAWRLVLGTWAFSAAAGGSGAAATLWSVWGSGERSGETNLSSVWCRYHIPSPNVRTLGRSEKSETTWGKEGWRTEVRSDPVESLMNIITLLETDWHVTERDRDVSDSGASLRRVLSFT